MRTQQPTETQQGSTHILAVASLILSILGLLPILPIVGSIGGIVTGYIARKEILSGTTNYQGAGTARAGIILGWIGIALALILACLIIISFVPFVRSGAVIQTGPVFEVTVVP